MTDTVHARPAAERPAVPAPTDWDRVFRPRAVAVVGASSRPESWMARPLRWLLDRGYDGHVYPVNPRYPELGGTRCYPALADVPGPVDLVLALVPAAQAVETVRAAGAVGATAVVVFASGFAETGPEGVALQQRLVDAGRRAGVRVLGPNCQGVVYTPARLFATFTGAAERPLTGGCGIAYVGQSGAIGGSVLDLAAERGLDLTAWVSTGNQADVDLVEIATHLVHDPEVTVLTVYAESIGDGAAYERLAAQAAATGTALVILRSGRSGAGRRAVVSHTGAMVGDDTAFTLVSRRHGVVLVDDVEELLAVATVLRARPRPAGRRIAAVSTSGGAGILAADRCEAGGLTLPELAPATQDKLSRLVPDFGAVANPVDVTAQVFHRGERVFGEVCAIVCADASVDALLVLVTMVTEDAATDLAQDLVAAVADTDVPCSVVWLAGQDRTTEARALLRAAGIPVFSSITLAARVAAAVAPPEPTAVDAPQTQAQTQAGPPPEPVASSDPTAGWELLDTLGVPRPRFVLARTAREAAEAARRLDGPVALKTVAPGLEHKTDAGGVRLAVPPDRVAEVFAELVATVPGLDGVLVQQMAPPGLELLVGASAGRDGWPPVLTVGLGGTATEIHRDLATALAPVTAAEAAALLASLRVWPLLAGHRGAPALDVAAAVDVLVRVGAAIAHRPDLAELEINPLIVGTDGVLAVDVLTTRTDSAEQRCFKEEH